MKCLLAIQKCSLCNEFTIHGLWGLEETKNSKHCKHSKHYKHSKHERRLSEIHERRLSEIHINNNIKQQLEHLWFSDKKFHHTNQWFWKHEYDKHGHDLFPNNPNMYFEITLKAFHFVKNNILPHFMQHLQDIRFAKNELRITLDYNIQTQQFTYKYTPTKNNRFDSLANLAKPRTRVPRTRVPPGFRPIPPGFKPINTTNGNRSSSRYHQYTTVDF